MAPGRNLSFTQLTQVFYKIKYNPTPCSISKHLPCNGFCLETKIMYIQGKKKLSLDGASIVT